LDIGEAKISKLQLNKSLRESWKNNRDDATKGLRTNSMKAMKEVEAVFEESPTIKLKKKVFM